MRAGVVYLTENPGKRKTMESIDNGRFSEIYKQLTHKQRKFLALMQDGKKTKREVAEELEIGESTVYGWPKIIDEALEIIDQDELNVARTMRRQALIEAMQVKIEGLKSENEKIQQDVATEILEAELGKAAQAIDLNTRHETTIKLEQLTNDELNVLAKVFEESGLDEQGYTE